MKRNAMKTAAATAMLVLCTASASLAQPQGGPPDPAMMAERQLDQMTERLKLTKDQQKQLKPIMLDSAKQMMKMREKMKNREAVNAKVNAVLTDDQKKEYEKMLSERRQMGPGGPGGQGGGRKRP